MVARGFAEKQHEIEERITQLERNRRARGGGGAPGPPGPPGLSGTTAQRDAMFPPPSTPAQMAALANQQVRFFNTTLGWEESYYATLGTPGLTARSLQVDVLSGWYATGGSTWIRTVITEDALFPTPSLFYVAALVLKEKLGDLSLSGASVTISTAGRYRLDAALSTSGKWTGQMGFSASGGGGGGERFFPTVFVDAGTVPCSQTVTTTLQLWAGDIVSLIGVADSAPDGPPTVLAWAGFGATRLDLTYEGPLLQGS